MPQSPTAQAQRTESVHRSSEVRGTLPTLTVVIPALNEARTLRESIERVRAVEEVTEIIVVDDGSDDDTWAIADKLARETEPLGRIRVVRLARNQGKGSAVRAALYDASGEYVCVHDADLEYDPLDLVDMLTFAAANDLPVVYGSRRLKGDNSRGAVPFYLGGVAMTFATNLIYGSRLTDEPTCYKMIRTDLLRSLDIEATGFEFCPEVTGKLLRAGYEIREVPIGYDPRTVAEGKKIRAADAWIGFLELLKWRRRPSAADPPLGASKQ
jgi:glycosyltransferase involved in cell wall biosynthesis